MRMMNVNGNDDATAKYNEASTRSAVAALKHLFQLEREFAILTQSDANMEDMEDVHADDQIEDSQPKKGSKILEKRWRCSNCRFINDTSTDSCEVCGSENQNAADPPPAPSALSMLSPALGYSASPDVPDTVRNSPKPKVKATPVLRPAASPGASPGPTKERNPISMEGTMTDFDYEALDAEIAARAEGTAAAERAPLADASAFPPQAGPEEEERKRWAALEKRPDKRDADSASACTGPAKCNQQ